MGPRGTKATQRADPNPPLYAPSHKDLVSFRSQWLPANPTDQLLLNWLIHAGTGLSMQDLALTEGVTASLEKLLGKRNKMPWVATVS